MTPSNASSPQRTQHVLPLFWPLALAAGILLALVSCGGASAPAWPSPETAPGAAATGRAFYFWRTSFSLSPTEEAALKQLGVTRIYLRFFDVAANAPTNAPTDAPTDAPIDAPTDLSTHASAKTAGAGGAGPAAAHSAAPRLLAPVVLGRGARLPEGIEIAPVVFIENRALEHLGKSGSMRLGRSLWLAVKQRSSLLGLPAPREMQVDCDWTDSTQAAYFALLRSLGDAARLEGARLSATVRLHQIKYRERTGVPPVERGMAMVYNLAPVSGRPGARAIYDLSIVESYLGRIADYPLPLDVALPIFSWTVQSRGGRVERLIDGVSEAELAAGLHCEHPSEHAGYTPAGAAWLQQLAPGQFLALQSRFFHGAMVRDGDLLLVDSASAPALHASDAASAPSAAAPETTFDALDAARRVAKHLQAAPRAVGRTVALFDLSERNLRNHDSQSLDRVFQTLAPQGAAPTAALSTTPVQPSLRAEVALAAAH